MPKEPLTKWLHIKVKCSSNARTSFSVVILKIMESCEFCTDTATMCIFDLMALRHRLHDSADWWSMAREEITEMNLGNVALINLGSDGKYSVMYGDVKEHEYSITCNLHFPSGRIFIGAGEEITSDGLEPECVRGGVFVNRAPGYYRIAVARRMPNELALHIGPSTTATNSFGSLLRI